MDPVIDDGGEDGYGSHTPQQPDDSTAGPLEAARDAMREGHDETLQDLPASPFEEAPAAQDQHSQMLDELVGPPQTESAAAPSPTPTEQVASVSLADTSAPTQPTPQPTGRFYVPPRERTAATRAERRAEHDRQMSGLTQIQAAAAPNLEGFLQQGGQVPDAEPQANVGAGGGGEQNMNLMESFYKLGAAQNAAIIELIKRVDHLTETLERARV